MIYGHSQRLMKQVTVRKRRNTKNRTSNYRGLKWGDIFDLRLWLRRDVVSFFLFFFFFFQFGFLFFFFPLSSTSPSRGVTDNTFAYLKYHVLILQFHQST